MQSTNQHHQVMMKVLLFIVMLSVVVGQDQGTIVYPERSLPVNNTIHPSKVNGYNWTLGIVATFTLSFSDTPPYMMKFAVDEINNNPDLCPGVKLQLNYAEVLNEQSNAVVAALYEVLVRKVRGIAGGFPSAETVNIQLISKYYQVPQISARANTDDLTDKTTYPYFVRTTMADSMQSRAILKLFNQFNWKKAILIYTNEQYGTSGNSLMLNYDLEIYSVRVSTTSSNYSEPLGQIEKFVKEQGCRVFLFFMLPPNFIPFMRALNNTYASSDFVYILTTPVASSMIEYPKAFANSMPNVDGALLVTAAVGSGPVYEEKNPIWNSLNNTYPGLRPDPYSFWNWYDTIYVFAHALDNLMKSRGITESNLEMLDSINGSEYLSAIKKVDFMGATGRVVFDDNANLIGTAGIWNLRNGVSSIIGTFYGNTSELKMTDSAVFFGGRTSIPSDSYILPIVRGSGAIRTAMGILTGICILVACIVACFLFFQPEAFSKSGRFYCGVIIFGALLAFAAAIIAIPEPTEARCLAFPWFLGMGFMLVFGCLFLRTWALFQVFRAAEQMKKINLNPIVIMKILGVFLLTEAIFMIVWSVVDAPKIELVNIRDDTEQQKTCGPGNIVFWGVFIGYKGVWMLFGAIISFMVRNVREDYNQSAGLGMSVYNCFGVTVVAVVLGFILDDPDAIQVISVLAILLAFTTTIVLLFGRPIWCIITGQPVHKDTVPDLQASYSGRAMKSSSGKSNKSGQSASAHSAGSVKSKDVEVELA